MHIGLRYVRQVVVYHMTDAIDIDAARGDVGGDQRPHLALAKRRQHAFALALRFVAVDRLGGDAGPHQALHHLVGAMFGPGEDQRAVDGLLAQHVDQDRRLGGAIDANDALLDGFDRGGVRHDRNLSRVAENISVCRSLGSLATILRMSWIKPMSSMRSASSSTKNSTSPRRSALLCTRSSSRPGVATMMSTPLSSERTCPPIDTPPMASVDRRCRWRP